MNEVREIVTRAVVAKGKKIFRVNERINPTNDAFSILGCWVINHNFEAELKEKKVDLKGNFEVNVWYAYDNNTKTDIARSTINYDGCIKVEKSFVIILAIIAMLSQEYYNSQHVLMR